MRNSKAFTLLEMLIVIAIISILFLAMGININSLQNEARISKATADIKTVQIAVEAYYKNYMYDFPPEEDYQAVLLEVSPRVLEGNLIDPFGETSASLYKYKLSANGNYYVIYSLGVRRAGVASVSDGGKVASQGDPVWVSNGHL